MQIVPGVWVTYMLCAALAGWAVATWDRPYREPIAAHRCRRGRRAFVVSRLPAERIVRGRYREAFFLTWSLLDVALICTLAYLDVGITSPATLMLFLTLVFSALSYPLASMIVVVARASIGVAVLGVVGGLRRATFEARRRVRLGCSSSAWRSTGVLCVWQSRLGERQRDELAELSRTDPLTGCLNRRGFAERLDAELARAEREGTEVALVQLDLNGFKAVNDRHGHAAGDELLRWVGSTLQGSAARVGRHRAASAATSSRCCCPA